MYPVSRIAPLCPVSYGYMVRLAQLLDLLLFLLTVQNNNLRTCIRLEGS